MPAAPAGCGGCSLIPVEDFGFICELEQARGQADAVAREAASTARVTGLRLTPIGSVEGAEQILSGTSLLVIERDEGRGLADLTGKVLTDRTYKYFFGLDHGLIEAEIAGDENLGKNGVLDQGGHLVVPCTYNDIQILSPRWVIGIALTGATEADYDYTGYSGDTKKYYQIAAADVYYVRDGQGNLLKTLSRQEYESAEALDDYIIR